MEEDRNAASLVGALLLTGHRELEAARAQEEAGRKRKCLCADWLLIDRLVGWFLEPVCE